jgi:hypothetical protein
MTPGMVLTPLFQGLAQPGSLSENRWTCGALPADACTTSTNFFVLVAQGGSFVMHYFIHYFYP